MLARRDRVFEAMAEAGIDVLVLGRQDNTGSEATGPGAAFVALKALLDPTTPFNGGSFRPIKVITEKGSILRSTYPAACGCSSLTMYTGGVAVAGALAEAVREAMCSHGSWGMTHTYITGWDHERNKENMYFDMSTGGSAATHGQDGFDATANYDKGDFGWFVSTETIENIFPTLMVERNELWTDSGGAGAARGGWACAGAYACWMFRQASPACWIPR